MATFEIWKALLAVNTINFLLSTSIAVHMYLHVFLFLRQTQDDENQEWCSPHACGTTGEVTTWIAAQEGSACPAPAASFSAGLASAHGNPKVALSPPRTPSSPPFAIWPRGPRYCAGLYGGPRFHAQAIEALYYAADSHLVKLFEDATLLAGRVKCFTVYDSHLCQVRRIRGTLE